MKLKKLHGTAICNDMRPCRFQPFALTVTAVMYILTVTSFVRYQTLSMLPLAAYPVFLAASCEVGYRDVFYKIFAVSPFIIFIGIFNPFFDPEKVEFMGFFAARGWLSFSSIIIKFILTASSVLFTTSAVGFDGICRSLAAFGLPEAIVTQFFLFNRYIRLLSDEMHNIIRARLFRGGRITLANAGNICGPLLLRSFSRSDRINEALMCRGYSGRLYNNNSGLKIFKKEDIYFILLWAVFFVLVRFSVLRGFLGGLFMRCWI